MALGCSLTRGGGGEGGEGGGGLSRCVGRIPRGCLGGGEPGQSAGSAAQAGEGGAEEEGGVWGGAGCKGEGGLLLGGGWDTGGARLDPPTGVLGSGLGSGSHFWGGCGAPPHTLRWVGGAGWRGRSHPEKRPVCVPPHTDHHRAPPEPGSGRAPPRSGCQRGPLKSGGVGGRAGGRTPSTPTAPSRHGAQRPTWRGGGHAAAGREIRRSAARRAARRTAWDGACRGHPAAPVPPRSAVPVRTGRGADGRGGERRWAVARPQGPRR